MPHPRLQRGEGLRTRAEQIVAEEANKYLDEQPVERKIPSPVRKEQKPLKTYTLNH